MKPINWIVQWTIAFCLLLLTAMPAYSSCASAAGPAGEGENGANMFGAMVPSLSCSNGAPAWSVNMVNMNLYVTDTPLWYDPAIGPPVRIKLNYNSFDNPYWVGLFGRGWRFNYGFGSRFGGRNERQNDPLPILGSEYTWILPEGPVSDTIIPQTEGYGRANIFLPDSRRIDFDMQVTADSWPLTLPVKEDYTQFYGELKMIDPTHYELHMENGDLIYYTRLDEILDWYTYSCGQYYIPCQPCENVCVSYSEALHKCLQWVCRPCESFPYECNGNSIVYNDFSQINAIEDRYGNQLTFAHNGLRPTTITDAEGRQTTITYNEQGLIARIDDPFGRFATFEYNDDLCLTKITDMNGYWTEFEYDVSVSYVYSVNAKVHLTAIRDSRGETRFKHEIGSRTLSGAAIQPPYQAPDSNMNHNHRITVTHPDSTKEEFFFCGTFGYGWHVKPEHYMAYIDEHRNNYASEVPKTLYYYTNTAKGQREQVMRIISPQGHTMATYYYDYDTQNVTHIYDGLNNLTQYAYNDKGRITSVTDPLNRVTDITYAPNQLDVTSISNALGTVDFEYNANRDLIAIRDRRELTATTGDDPTGMGLRETLLTYNGHGQLTSITDPADILSQLTYNTAHQVTAIQRDSHQVATFSYDPLGRVAGVTDATGLHLEYTYDNLDRVTRITYPDDKSIAYAYSGCCPRLLDNITDRGGRTTYFDYDNRKNLVKITRPGQKTIRFKYDTDKNLVELLDLNNNSTRFAYDPAGRLIQKTYHDGKSVAFEYDNADRLVQSTNARGIVAEYEYNNLSDLVAVTYSDNTPDMTISYDAYSRVTGITDGSGTHTFSYYLNSALKSVDGPWPDDTITYQYDRLDRVTSLTPQGGTAVSYVYDTLHRLSTVTSGDQTHTYQYSGINPLVQGLTRPNGSTTTYSYDNLNRLTQITNNAQTSLVNRFAYTRNDRDLIDNETVESADALTALGDSLQRYDYNALNQLLDKTNPDQGFEYDPDGNLIKGFTPQGHAFTADYDAENNLTSIQYLDGDGILQTTTFIYDYNGFLTRIKTYANHGLTADLRIVRSGFLALQDRDHNNNTLRQYTWGLNMGGGIGGLLTLRQESSNYQYLYDGKGNVTTILDAAAQPVASYHYDAFGKLLSRSGTLDQPYTFSTKRYFQGPGLNYYGYRFYQPSVGRWLTRDPLQEAGGLNLYGFVNNNPINLIDPYGLTDDPIPGLKVTYYDIPLIEQHLQKIAVSQNLCSEDQKPERDMLKRLMKGKKTKHDYEFWMHERIEGDLMRTKYNHEYTYDNLRAAHMEALEIRQLHPHDIWHPDVLMKNKQHFPTHWNRYWKK